MTTTRSLTSLHRAMVDAKICTMGILKNRYLLFIVAVLSSGCDAKVAPSKPASSRLGVSSVVLPQASNAPPSDKPNKTYSREEFKKQVIGKTMDEVKALLGKPYGTSSGNGQAVWYYTDIVYESTTKQLDTLTYLHFADGKVERVDE